MAVGCSNAPPPAAEPGKPEERQLLKIQVQNKTRKTKTVTRGVPRM
jgi:hypothetical protein